MDVSLDDFIKTKKIGKNTMKNGVNRQNTLRKVTSKPQFKKTARVLDARIKIVQKKRQKIEDARDRLVEITRSKGDVRKTLLEKKKVSAVQRRSAAIGNGGHKPAPIIRRNNIRISTSSLKPERSQLPKRHITPPAIYRHTTNEATIKRRIPNAVAPPRGYVDYDNMEKMEEEEYAVARGLSRTVDNDISPPYESNYVSSMRSDSIPAPPRRLNSWGSSNAEHFDPFDVYDVPVPHRERRMSPDIMPPVPKVGFNSSSLHENNPALYQRRYIPETNTHLSYEMRSRLENSPDPHASMGIFANSPRGLSQYSADGYRIVVSNLNHNITHADIKELFEDIGPLYDSRIVRPGVAEVIYKILEDAEKAVETYHNRQLDNQPMKCLLVNPRSSNKPTAPAIKAPSSNPRIVGHKTPLEIDIDALHKVLFRR